MLAAFDRLMDRLKKQPPTYTGDWSRDDIYER
jgi:hypothetical protein